MHLSLTRAERLWVVMITPREIEEKGFRMSFRGYNTDDVDDFLQEICDSYTEIYESNRRLKEKTGRLSDAVGQYKSMEDTLSDALNVAGKSADEIEEDANGKAEQIIRNAELTAQSIIGGAEQKIAEEQYRYENIKREIEIYKAKIIELLNAQLCVLKGYPKSASLEEELASEAERNNSVPTDAVAKPKAEKPSKVTDESGDESGEPSGMISESSASAKAADDKGIETDAEIKKPKAPTGGANLTAVENIVKGAAARAAENIIKDSAESAEENIKVTADKTEDIKESHNEIGVSDDKVKDDADDFGDTAEFEPVADSYGNDSENAFDKAADDAASKEYKNCDTESLPCVSMDKNGGYTVHKNQ